MEPENSRAGTVKTFTLKEANAMLPYVSKIFEKVTSLNDQIKSITFDIENLVSIWGKDVLENGHIDNEYYFSMVSQRENTFQNLIKIVGDMQSMGCVIKDIDKGLIDFYYDNEGELVFLCWKYGEDKIMHWHPVDGGFTNRSSINQLKQ